jgi:hypothetical protein
MPPGVVKVDADLLYCHHVHVIIFEGSDEVEVFGSTVVSG